MKTLAFALIAATSIVFFCPASARAEGRPAKGRGAEVFIMGDSVTFFFSMKEAAPQYPEKTVIWQRWQLSCKKDGRCSGLSIYKLSDMGEGRPCSVGLDAHIGARYEKVKFDLAAGAVVVRIEDPLLGEGDLKIGFDPKTLRIRTAEVDFLQKADSPEEIESSPFAQEEDEVRKFRLPEASSIARNACVFLVEGAAPLP